MGINSWTGIVGAALGGALLAIMLMAGLAALTDGTAPTDEEITRALYLALGALIGIGGSIVTEAESPRAPP